MNTRQAEYLTVSERLERKLADRDAETAKWSASRDAEIAQRPADRDTESANRYAECAKRLADLRAEVSDLSTRSLKATFATGSGLLCGYRRWRHRHGISFQPVN